MVSKKDKNAQRLKRHARVRAKLSGTTERPRLAVTVLTQISTLRSSTMLRA